MESAMLITQEILKYRSLKNVVFVIFLLQLCLVFGQQKVVVIDPGHGGNDTGANSTNGLKEKDVVLQVAKEMVKFNKTLLNDEFDIYLTRYKDSLILLSDRTRLAKSLKADVFISLHCNAAKTLSKGIEVYVHNSDKLNTKVSISLGLSILKETTERLGFKQHGIKFANFQVLKEASYYPSILLEMGFMTNDNEADYYLKPQNIRAMALAILIGTINYINFEI